MRYILAVFFFCLPQILAACPTADDLEAGGSTPGLALERCYELGRFEIPSGRGNIPVTMFGTRRSDEQYIDLILEGLTFAGASLADIGPLTTEPLEVFISPTDYAFEEGAAATATPSVDVGTGNPATCVIVTFPGVGGARYAFNMAHEFFHCVQFNEFSDQEQAGSNDFWVEASAEWFANITYPNSTFSDRFVDDFDHNSIETPLTQMSYDNVVFFFWYSARNSPAGVIELLRGMSTTGAHDDALAEFVSDEDLQQFAKDYFDKNITQPGGRTPPSNPRYTETVRWDEDETENFEAVRFRIYRARLEFACGEWEVEERDLEGMTTVMKLPDGDWEDVPDEVSSEDGEDITYRFVGVATGADGFSVEIEAKKKPCSLCPRIVEDDDPAACLVGEWHLASGGLGAKIGQLLNSSTELENVDYPDLDGVLILNEDGTFVARTDDDGHLESVTEGGDRIIGDVNFNFESSGTWGVNGERFEQCSLPPDININLESLETRTGITSTINQNEYLGPQRENRTSRKFTCENGRLVLTEGGFFAPKIEWVYTR